MIGRPPRLAVWLVGWSLARRDRDAVLGDLLEEFRTREARDGAWSARRWYWRQVRRSLPHILRHRAEGPRDPHEPGSARRPFNGSVQDLTRAVRSLRATPGFTAVALAVLALGIGATTAIYSVVDGVALRGLPFPGDDRLVIVAEPRLTTGRGLGASVPEFRDWRSLQQSFEDLAAARGGRGFVTKDDAAETLRVTMVTAGLFPLLRGVPALGRAFGPDDEIPGHEHVVILSDAFWKRHFGADPGVVGRPITFDTGVWSIVGVMPASFMYPASHTTLMDMWVPLAFQPAELARGDSRSLSVTVVGRLKRGVSIGRARADMERITGGLKLQSPKWFRDLGVSVVSLRDTIVGPVKAWMLMLLGAVAFVLLIACVNVANLLLARSTTRARDVAVRSALGASRWRLVRGLLAESLVLSVAGAAVGLALAIWGVHVLRAALPPNLPRLADVAVNYRVLMAAAAMAVAVAIGVTPVWQASPVTAGASLREAGRSGGVGAARSRARSTLLGAEIALAVVLLVGSGLFISSFVRLIRVDLGFDVSRVLSVDVSPRHGSTDADVARLSTSVGAILDAVRGVPGVDRVALVSGTPPLVLGDDQTMVTVPGKPPFTDRDDYADDKLITPDYFRVLRVPVVRGRDFMDADALTGAPRVVVLNDIAATRYFGQSDPVGTTVSLSSGPGAWTVVGVVRSVRLHGPEGELRPEVYTPLDWRQFHGNPLLTILMRTSSDPGPLAPVIRDAVRAAAPHLATPTLQTYDELFSALVAQRKFNMIVLALFGVLAVAIAGTGIYGVMAYVVEQRTQEIGVRMALGADPSRVVGMVLGSAMRTMAIGLAIGLTGGWLLARFVRAFLFKSDAHDPIVYAAAGAALVAAGLLAALIPARRASQVDPVVALRAQ